MPGFEVINFLHAQLIFTMLINVKMPTNVGILTFISMINTISESLKARIFIQSLHHSTIYEQDKFHAQLSMKSYTTSGQVLPKDPPECLPLVLI